MKYMRKGWYGESHRHYLAAKGVKTSLMSRGGTMLDSSFMLGKMMSIEHAAHEGKEAFPRAKAFGESTGMLMDKDFTVMDSAKLSGERGVERVHHTATHYLAKQEDDDVYGFEESKRFVGKLSSLNKKQIAEQQEAAEEQENARWKENQEEAGYMAKKKDEYENSLFSDNELEAISKGVGSEAYDHVYGIYPIPEEHRSASKKELERRNTEDDNIREAELRAEETMTMGRNQARENARWRER